MSEADCIVDVLWLFVRHVFGPAAVVMVLLYAAEKVVVWVASMVAGEVDDADNT